MGVRKEARAIARSRGKRWRTRRVQMELPDGSVVAHSLGEPMYYVPLFEQYPGIHDHARGRSRMGRSL
jgi:hypothetical protein